MKKTLERVISKAGLGSRTEARKWIHERRVYVNGRVIENPDHWVNFTTDKVLFDGKPLESKARVYLLLHKPTGYITTYRDPEGRPTVYDLIPGVETFVSPVGRLDLDTSGLLLLTNDTQLAERMTNPDHKVPKTYLVECSTVLEDAAIDRLRNGVTLSDGPTLPAQVRRLGDPVADHRTRLEITIHEGRNRQVRRMIEAVDSKVVTLERTRIGKLTLDGLAVGKYRPLSEPELQELGVSATPKPATPSGRKSRGAGSPRWRR